MDTTAHSVELVNGRGTIAGGDTDRIPRIFLGAGDVAALTAAFFAANRLAPDVQRLFLSGGLLEGTLRALLPVPAVARPELFPPLSEIIWLLAVTTPVTLVALELLRAYEPMLSRSLARVAAAVALSQTVAISFSALIVFALKLSDSSRVLVFTFGLLSTAMLIAYRGGVWAYQRHRLAEGAYAKNVVLIGPAAIADALTNHIRKQVTDTQFHLMGWLDTGHGSANGPTPVHLPRLGHADDLGELLIRYPIHEVVAVQPSSGGGWLPRVMEHCDYFRIRLRIVPEVLLTESLHDLEFVYRGDPLKLPEVVLVPPHLDADVLFVKRVMDILVASVMLLLLAPLFLIIALAIKLTTPRLPVLYPWHVIGFSGRPFTGYKFTTMVADADDQKDTLLTRNEMQGPVFKIKDDPRVTPLGRILRKFSLNELPQLWSVLKGDMSLVGPRPAFPYELAQYELWHKRKLTVKPGLTCLWQVSGRNRISSFDDWVRLDLEYIENWSLWLDIRILARTVGTIMSGSGS